MRKCILFLDACYMLKLMRNLLADYGTISHIVDSRKEDIKGEYIVALNDIQEDLGLSFANKLKKKHVDWTKHKMKVNLAAQTLSSSVTTAIDFLRDEMSLPQFQGSEATTTFIRTIDDAFDALNSWNPHAKGSKAPVTATTLADFITRKKLQHYIFNLHDEKGRYLCNTRRKMAVWGFSFTLESVMSLCQDLLTLRHL